MNTVLVAITPRKINEGAERQRRPLHASAPRAPQAHLFETEYGPHLLIVNGSRVYQISDDVRNALSGAMRESGGAAVDEMLKGLGLDAAPYIKQDPATPPVRALSLAVAQKCNLGCTYCYAQEGGFGDAPKDMSEEVAIRSVELLFSSARRGERVNLAFLGGEPLVNRAVLRAATDKAVEISESKGVRVSFSITTNGTLLTAADGDFFEKHGFSVTVSLDGVGDSHDRLRPLKGGQGSYDRVMANVAPLLATQRRMQISARVTVTPFNLRLTETLDQLVRMGFHSVGFSPMLSSPTGRCEMDSDDLEVMLNQMIACGEQFERHVLEGQRYPFLNMVNAMREIHEGTHRPYPCGAGAGYFGVSAEGGLFACHRFVNDERGAMGSITEGVSHEQQRQWLGTRHVHFQDPCKSCWARYMCGGGCHHEVINRGRDACDYIRGWLHYCLQAYVRLSERRPDYFGLAARQT